MPPTYINNSYTTTRRGLNHIKMFMALLIFYFWLSGLFVFCVIFININNLDQLILFTFLSYAVGSFAAGILSDIVGRKVLFTISSILLAVASIIMLYNVTVALLLANLVIAPLNNLTFVYIKYLTPQTAAFNSTLVLIGWAVSYITLGIFFMFFTAKTFIYLLLAATVLYALLAVLLTYYSPYFAARQARYAQIANENQSLVSSLLQPVPQYLQHYKFLSSLAKQCSKLRILPKNRKSLAGGCLIMFMMQMFYYRTQFTLDRFGLSLTLNTIVVGSTEILANLVFIRFATGVRRRLALQILILCLMGLLLLLMLIPSDVLQTIVYGVMRFVDTVIMIVLAIYLPELFDVRDRGKGTNFVMSFGVIGSALSGIALTKLPFGYLQIFLLAALVAASLMPETKGIILKDENIYSEFS